MCGWGLSPSAIFLLSSHLRYGNHTLIQPFYRFLKTSKATPTRPNGTLMDAESWPKSDKSILLIWIMISTYTHTHTRISDASRISRTYIIIDTHPGYTVVYHFQLLVICNFIIHKEINLINTTCVIFTTWVDCVKRYLSYIIFTRKNNWNTCCKTYYTDDEDVTCYYIFTDRPCYLKKKNPTRFQSLNHSSLINR